jgi:transmembrane sensor
MASSGKTKMGLEAQAADWLVRIQAADVGDEDLAALTEWLGRSPHHQKTFDHAEAVWLLAEALPAEASGQRASVVEIGRYRKAAGYASRSRPRRAAVALAAAAAVCAAVGLAFVLSAGRVTEFDYATAKGKTRTVNLADGTILALNSATHVHVRLSRAQRAVTLAEGEVALTVTHDARRPLVLTAGDLVASDLGTQFDVLRHGGLIRVAVKDGVVGLSMAAGPSAAAPLTLKAGEGVQHREGSLGFSGVAVDPNSAYAWQSGRVVYKNQPLSEVASDLSRYFDKPIVVDEQTGKMGVTAVFTLDSEASVVRSLQSFLPIEATTTGDAIVLRANH